MKTLLEYKGTLMAVGLFIVVIIVYNTFFKGDSLPVPDELPASNVGNDLLKIRADLQRVTFDPTLFTDPKYLNLTDFSSIISDQPTGRPNPFNIIGRD